jgi:predicted alpha/beta superfamily hydrolase
MKRRLIIMAVLCFAVCSIVASEPITIGETVTLQSKVLDEERTILVSTPPGYEHDVRHYPVLYMTDGNAHLTHTRGAVDFLARNGLMPQVIIIGINNTDRTRDLTPTHVDSTTVNGRVFEHPTSGGAPKFLNFFERELFPYVEANYRTLPLRFFAGHSFGGLFALDALFTHPEMFKAVIAVSPSLNWDDDLPIREAESFFKRRDTLDMTLFVSMANEEAGDPAPTRLDRLERELEKTDAKGFEWQVMRMPDETHGSVVLRAHYWGLRKVFEGWQLPADPETGQFMGGLDELEVHYAELSKRFGVTIVPAEQTVNLVGYQILGRDDFEGAIEVFRFNVELYPESANVYDSLGEALENAGRLEEAYANYAKAVENAAKIDDDRLSIFVTNRDRVKAQLDKATKE